MVAPLVRPVLQMGWRKREPGENPGLPRSGKWERQLSMSTGTDGSGKRQPVGDRLGDLAHESEDLPAPCMRRVQVVRSLRGRGAGTCTGPVFGAGSHLLCAVADFRSELRGESDDSDNAD